MLFRSLCCQYRMDSDTTPVLQPLETISPVLNEPYLPGKSHPMLEFLPKVTDAQQAEWEAYAMTHLDWFYESMEYHLEIDDAHSAYTGNTTSILPLSMSLRKLTKDIALFLPWTRTHAGGE